MSRGRAYLAMVVLAGWAAPAGAQGLVITPLPSEQVIEAVVAPLPVPQPVPDAGPQPPARAGLPKPSIIIGDLAVLAGFDPRGPLGLAFESRRAIRQRDAGLFERLLGMGAFDPDEGRQAEAIQTELRRMACYGGAIDGAWGSGSESAVGRWSQAAGAVVDDRPGTGLFRAILRGGELQCATAPVPTAAAPAPAAPRAAAARAAPARESRAAPTASRSQPSPARSRPRQPAPAEPAPSRQINPSLMGSGLFR